MSPYLNLNLRRCHELRPARRALPRKRVRSVGTFSDMPGQSDDVR
jgi:hypothetical protein